jgi:hypothetical protein
MKARESEMKSLHESIRTLKAYLAARARKRWAKSEARRRGAWQRSWLSRTDGFYAVNLYPTGRDGAWDLCVVNMGTEAGYSWLSFANADAARQRSFEAVEVVRGYETATGIVD